MKKGLHLFSAICFFVGSVFFFFEKNYPAGILGALAGAISLYTFLSLTAKNK